MIEVGKYRAEAVRFGDGVGCCVWIPFENDNDSGLCFDFPHEDIDNLIEILDKLKVVEPKVYVAKDEGEDEENETYYFYQYISFFLMYNDYYP